MALPVNFFWRKRQTSNKMNGWLALSPLFVFILIYILSAIFAHSFYAVPISVPFILATVYAAAIMRQYETTSKIVSIFSDGAGNRNVLLMIWMVILAGAFASTSKSIGAIDAITDIVVAYLPGRFLYAGLFLAACVISVSIGTNIGTIVALLPIVINIADETGLNLAFLSAIVVGGGTFGDNISFISDTTIAATSTLGCEQKDKFRANIQLVGPAALIVCIIYLIAGNGVNINSSSANVQWVTLLPYIATITFAIIGVNVVTVLTLGIMLNGLIGVFKSSYSIIGWMQSIGEGIGGLNELIIVIMISGGMLEIIRYNGGIDFIVHKITKMIHGKRSGEFSIATLVSIATLCTANNTIAIITTGKIAKEITEKNGINPIKTASILDTYSCVFQSLIPYGMHLLLVSAMTQINALGIIKYLYYPFILIVISSLAILFRLPRKYS